MNDFKPNPHVSPDKIKKSLSKHKTNNSMDYDNFYNEINYVSPGIHMKTYYDICMSKLSEYDMWLDVGCGCGHYIKNAIAEKNITVHGMDVVDKSVSQANKEGIICIKHSAAQIYPYSDETFDMVTSTDVLEHLHISDVDQALREIYRVLKCGKYSLLAPATTPDKTGLLHLTVKPREWWVEKLQYLGFTVEAFVGEKGILLYK